MTQASVQSIAVSMNSEDFHTGFVEGLTGVAETRRFVPSSPMTEDDIVGVIRNLTEIAVEGWLSEEQLRHDAGMIAGWLCRHIYP